MNFKILLGLVLFLIVLPQTIAFEINAKILDTTKVISAGDTAQIQVLVKDRENSGRHDVNFTYIVQKEGVVLTQTKEVRAVETQASFIKEITIPDNAQAGIYTVTVQVNGNEEAQDSLTVVSVQNPTTILENYLIIILSVVLFLGALILWEVHKVQVNTTKRART